MEMRSENQSCIILIIFLILFLVSCTKDPPVVTTTNIQDIKLTTATGNGRVWDDNGYEVTARGFCWSTTINPTLADSKTSDGGGTGLFKSTLTELTPNTKYYVRSYATNIKGTSYGAETSFTTLAGFIQDISGNSYRIIQVGMQVWMAENLKTTKYSYGESFPITRSGLAKLPGHTAGTTMILPIKTRTEPFTIFSPLQIVEISAQQDGTYQMMLIGQF